MQLPPTDKMAHFGAGAAVAGVAAAAALAVLHALKLPLWVAIPLAFAAAFAAGRWKERRDAKTGGDVQTGDWQATTWGAAPVALPIVVLVMLALLSGHALANGSKAPAAAPGSNATASATSSATAAGAPTNVYGGDYGVIALPWSNTTAAPLPAGMCQVGESHARTFVFGVFAHSDSMTRIDMECLRMVADLERLRAMPKPAPAVQLLTSFPGEKPEVSAACPPPARAKSVTAARKAGACRP